MKQAETDRFIKEEDKKQLTLDDDAAFYDEGKILFISLIFGSKLVQKTESRVPNNKKTKLLSSIAMSLYSLTLLLT